MAGRQRHDRVSEPRNGQPAQCANLASEQETLKRASAANPTPAIHPDNAISNATLRGRQFIFVLLLGAAVLFAILFGTRWLTQNVVSAYIVFVLLGGLASVLTWGLLSSTGEIGGTPYGFNIKLAGAIVPLVLITGGGVWATSSAEPFAVKFKLVNGEGQSVNVSGSARLEMSDDTRSLLMRDSDLLTFDHLPRSVQGKEAGLTLESDEFRLETPDRKYSLHPSELITIRVVPVPITKISGTVSFDHERLPAGTVSIAGRNCSGPIRDGYFEVSCDGLTVPVAIEITAPTRYAKGSCIVKASRATLAGNRIDMSLSKLVGNSIDVSCGQPPVRGDARPPRKRCLVDGSNPPNPWNPKDCPDRPEPKHDATTTSDYTRLFPRELGACDEVFVYTCPISESTDTRGAVTTAPVPADKQ